jgi:cell division protein FtsL
MLSVTRAAERFIHTNFLARQKIRRDTDEPAKDFVYMICMGLLIMTAFIMALWVRIYFLEIGYRISSAHRTGEELQQENKKLKIERAALSAPSRLELIASHKLGMHVPRNDQMVILPWSK